MIRIGLFLLAASAYAQTVSNITFDGTGDSSARVIFNVSAPFNSVQVRYGSSHCSSGSGQTVQGTSTQDGFQQFGMTAVIAGLAPSTTYFVCPEVSSNSGMTWSSGAETTLTTLARIQTQPLPPAPVSTAYPAQTGMTRTVASDCSNLQAQINAALPGDTIIVPAGTVCSGTYATPTAPEAKLFFASNVETSNSTLTITGHGFTENQEVHFSTAGVGLNCLPGMTIIPAASDLEGFDCDKSGGWNKDAKYYVHVVDTNRVQILTAPSGPVAIPGWINFTANTTGSTITFTPTWATPNGYAYVSQSTPIPANIPVQFISTGTLPGGLNLNTTYYLLSGCSSSPNAACTTQVSLSAGGTPMTLSSAGTGTLTIVDQGLGTMYIAPAPAQTGPWVLLTTSGTLPPAGTRVTSASDSQMFYFTNVGGYNSPPIFSTGILSHNWRITGARFDTGTNADYLTTTDPRPFCAGPTTYPDSRNIAFDQIRVQGPGYPNRLGCLNGGAAMFLDGGSIAITNSDLENMDFWHAWSGTNAGGPQTGLAPTVISTTQVTATAGVAYGGIFTTTVTGTPTINFTGGAATGNAYVYFAMDGTAKVLAPTGTTGNCTFSGTNCTFLTAASPAMPVDSNGRVAGLEIFMISLSSGAVTGASLNFNTTAFGPPEVSEGTNAMIAGSGPGPFLFQNNYVSGAGLTLHFDDSGGPFLVRGDDTITNNYFQVEPHTQLGGPQSDGLWYGNRQPLEWKGGQRILISGNTFAGCYTQDNPIGTCVVLTPRAGGYTTDVNIVNNQFGTNNGSAIFPVGGGTMIASPFGQHAPISKSAARQKISNNLFYINGWTQTAPGLQPQGWSIYGGEGQEDITISHNTVYDNRGQAPAFLLWLTSPVSGMSIADNIYFYTGNLAMILNGGSLNSNCTGNPEDKLLMDCSFTSGPGNPSYTFNRNLIVPSWADTSTPSGFIGPLTVQNNFPAPLVNYIPQGTSQPANVMFAGFSTITFPSYTQPFADPRLSFQSPYLNQASDGTQVGANIDQLQQAQGLISQLRTTALGSTTVTISAFVPVPGAPCYAGYGTNNQNPWTWTAADTTPSRVRNISISGLLSKTQYFYTLVCTNTAQPPTATLRTQ